MRSPTPGRPPAFREPAARRRRRSGPTQVRADDRLIEALRTGLLDRAEPCRLTDRLTRLLVRWRCEVRDGSDV